MKNDMPNLIDPEPKNQILPDSIFNYDQILRPLGADYIETGYYLQVGDIKNTQGWILHISVIKSHLLPLMEVVLPFLIDRGVPFKIPVNQDVSDNLIDGYFGYTKLGKVICIYPPTDVEALEIAKCLIDLSQSFKGPNIPTDICLGGCIFTRYGSFNPVVLSDEKGISDNYIYDSKGKLVRDIYTIPFEIPKGVAWPFASIANPIAPKLKKVFRNRYLPYIIIKPDAKGRVIKGINIKNIFKPHWCLIKEGKKCMCADESERDMISRLLWQKELHEDLSADIPLPQIIDYFIDNGDAYLVMDFIEGISLDLYQSQIYQNRSWIDLSTTDKLSIIDYAIEIIDILDRLHQKGYVHRDITAANFLIDKKKKMFLIDLELSYNMFKIKPHPPFKLGTPGCMSPEQYRTDTPTIEQDVYSLGTLLIVSFVRLTPSSFDVSSPDMLYQNLLHFIQDENLATAITRCLSIDPDNRPTIASLKKCLTNYKGQVESGLLNSRQSNSSIEINGTSLEAIIKRSLIGIANPIMLTSEGYWSSQTVVEENYIGNSRGDHTIYGGFHEGISGVLYLLGRAKTAGLPVDHCRTVIERNWEFVQSQYMQNISNLSPGLYSGAAGIALSIATAMKAGLLPAQNQLECLQQCLSLETNGFNISVGAAGQGLALMHCYDYLDNDYATARLQTLANRILKNQLKDGSWQTLTASNQPANDKALGFSHGVAGIIWFLLAYYQRYRGDEVKNAIVNGLRWIKEQSHKNGNAIFWYTSTKAKETGAYLDGGACGIALVFLRSYEIFGHPAYKKVAEDALEGYQHHIVDIGFSLSNGLAGLGEVYLEAYRVLKNDKWLDRANWIAEIFTHTTYEDGGAAYWLMDNPRFPNADLMVGNSGIIHFLIRTLLPNKVGFII